MTPHEKEFLKDVICVKFLDDIVKFF